MAGALEGDGCVYIIIDKQGKGLSQYRPRFQLTSTDRHYLQNLQRLLGFGRVKVANKGTDKHKTRYVYVIDSLKNLVFFLTAIKDYLVDKKRRVQAILDITRLKNIENQLVSPWIAERRYRKLRELNRKGPR